MRAKDPSGHANNSRRGKLAAAGVAAIAAAGLAAAPAQASSGKIYACYSKKSHEMKYSKGSHCARSSKSLSWNKMGPQGAQGAQGAQGPAGVTQTYYAYYDSTSGSGYFSTEAVPAYFTPTTAGYYQVNAVNDIYNSGSEDAFVDCYATNEQGTTHTTSMLATLLNATIEPVANTGVVYGSAADPIGDVCQRLGGSDLGIAYATINGTLADSAVVGTTEAKPAAAAHSYKLRQQYRKFEAAHPKLTKH